MPMHELMNSCHFVSLVRESLLQSSEFIPYSDSELIPYYEFAFCSEFHLVTYCDLPRLKPSVQVLAIVRPLTRLGKITSRMQDLTIVQFFDSINCGF